MFNRIDNNNLSFDDNISLKHSPISPSGESLNYQKPVIMEHKPVIKEPKPAVVAEITKIEKNEHLHRNAEDFTPPPIVNKNEKKLSNIIDSNNNNKNNLLIHNEDSG